MSLFEVKSGEKTSGDEKVKYIVVNKEIDGNYLKYEITNKSLINKIKYLIDDLNVLYENDNSFFDFFYDLHKAIIRDGFVLDIEKYTNEIVKYAKNLVSLRVCSVGNFCDVSKKTKSSVFFDNDEMQEVFELIAIMKILATFMHSKYKDTHKENIERLLSVFSEKYKNVNKKLYQIISSKTLRGNMENKKFMSFLKYSITYDYLILYNYSFITNIILGVYNWKTNPISFIVSVAAEHFNFLVMRYSYVPIVYKEELSLDVSSGNIFESVSYEMILNSLMDKMSKFQIQGDLYTTPMNDIVVLPLMEYITDIPMKYLKVKSNYEKLVYQYTIYYLLNRIKLDIFSEEEMKNINKLLLHSFNKNFIYKSSNNIMPMMLEILKNTFTYYGLDNKVPLINALRPFSMMIYKRSSLVHIITGESPKFDSSTLNDIFKSFALFMIKLVSDDTRDKIKKNLKIEFLDLLGDVKVSKSLGMYMI